LVEDRGLVLAHGLSGTLRIDPGDFGGLGLALVQSIMGLHAGTVQVTSEHGETVFSLRFPLHEQASLNA
jgi:signal transduction histidine kinase